MEIGRLVAEFTADSSKFEAGTKRVEQSAQRTAKSVQLSAKEIEQAMANASRAGITNLKAGDLKNFLTPAATQIPGQARTISTAVNTIGTSAKGSTVAARQLGRAIGQDLSNALGLAAPRLAAVAGAAGPLAAVAASLVAITATAAGIYKLATFSQQLAGDLFDLSTKINFSAETLSSLKVAAELSGGSLASLSTALGIFDRNIEEANDKTTEMSRIFKVLKLDTNDNELALRQAFTQLAKMTSGAQQTALAMKLFGRSGKEVLGVVKETNGNIEEFIKQMGGAGFVTSAAAKKADEFDKRLVLLRTKLEDVARQIGSELVPTVERAADDISRWLKQNQGEIIKTAKELGSLVSWVYALGKAIAANSPYTIAINVVRTFRDISTGSAQGAAEATARAAADPNRRRTYQEIVNPRAPLDLTSIPSRVRTPSRGIFDSPFRIAITAEQQAAANARKAQEALEKQLRAASGKQPGGGGGGGGDAVREAQRIAELRLKAVLDGLKAEEDANKRSLDLRRRDFNTYATQYMVIEERRHEAVVKGLDAEEKAAERLKKGREVALLEIDNKRAAERVTHEQNRNKILDERGTILDKINDFIRDQEREIVQITAQTGRWDQAYQQLVDTLKEEGVELESNTKKRIQSNIAQAKELELVLSVTRARQVLKSTRERFTTTEGRERPAWLDLGGGSTVGGEPGTTGRPRVATVELQVIRERAEMIREQMQDLASDLAGTFDRALYDGIHGGGMRGLESLSLGFLDLIQQTILGKLKTALAEALTAGASGGGWIAKLLGFFIPAGIGGGVSKLATFGGTQVKPDSSFTLGGTGTTRPRTVTPENVTNATRSITTSITQQTRERTVSSATQTQDLKNTIQLTGQQIVQGLTPAQQGFWSGLIQTAIGGAISGLAGALTSGVGGAAHPEGPRTPRPATAPTLKPFRPQTGPAFAAGGYLQPGKWGTAGERGTESIYGGRSGMTVVPSKSTVQPVINNNYTINLPQPPKGSYSSPKSQREMANAVLAALQGAQS